ncbi:MAG: LON peptidase substrate-binding domain-containing protein [Planctomycetaceae bacterium]
MTGAEALLASFPRRVALFPLRDVVLFPGALLPLHIFEPRYRRMVTGAFAGDGLIAIALLKPCTPDEVDAAAPFHDTVCLGRVVRHEPLPDGRSPIALLGLAAGVARAVEDTRLYRTVEFAPRLDAALPDEGLFRARLERAFARTLPGAGTLDALSARLRELVGAEHLPAALVNDCAFASGLLPLDKLRLLEEPDPGRRLDLLLEFLYRAWQWN